MKISLVPLLNEIQNLKLTKNSKGNGYNYIKLDKILKNTNEILQKGNFAVIQKLNDRGLKTDVINEDLEIVLSSGYLTLPRTVIQDGLGKYAKDGSVTEVIYTEDYIRIGKDTIWKTEPYKSHGSKITYFRRYQLSTLFGINDEEDLDGALLTRTEKTDLKKEIKELDKKAQKLENYQVIKTHLGTIKDLETLEKVTARINEMLEAQKNG